MSTARADPGALQMSTERVVEGYDRGAFGRAGSQTGIGSQRAIFRGNLAYRAVPRPDACGPWSRHYALTTSAPFARAHPPAHHIEGRDDCISSADATLCAVLRPCPRGLIRRRITRTPMLLVVIVPCAGPRRRGGSRRFATRPADGGTSCRAQLTGRDRHRSRSRRRAVPLGAAGMARLRCDGHCQLRQ